VLQLDKVHRFMKNWGSIPSRVTLLVLPIRQRLRICVGFGLGDKILAHFIHWPMWR
jgi:hypothetical protein